MSQSARHSLHDIFGLLRVLWEVACQSIKDIDYSPLVAVVHSSK